MRPPPFVNPPASRLGKINAILTGTSNAYHVANFEGSLSIKTVVRGSAVWKTAGRHFVVRENSWLVLNDRQRYTIDIEGRKATTTFCVFFRRGFVEDIRRAQVISSEELLSEPETDLVLYKADFFQRLGDDGDRIKGDMEGFHKALVSGEVTCGAAQDSFLRLGSLLVSTDQKVVTNAAKLPAIRSSTQLEICRRVLRGRDLLLSAFDQYLTLEDLAHEACMSPYHFHRSFRLLFGTTPHALLTRYRLQRATKLLQKTDDTITAICNQTGFESPTSFSKLFRRQFRQTPMQFRRQRQISKIG
jgi:AraC family transcriptional regulator